MNPRVAYRLYLGLQLLRREPVGEALTDVRRTERFSADQLYELQMRRRREQLLFAARYVPHFQEVLAPVRERLREVRDPDQLRELVREIPPLERSTVQATPERVSAQGVGPLPSYLDKTSGTSGEPLLFPCDQRAWAYRHALMFRAMEAYGVQLGEPYGYLFGSPWHRLAKWKVRLKDWVMNRSRVSAFELGPDMLERHVQRLRRRKPVFLMGYASAVYEFCMLCREHGYDLRELPLKAMFISSEPFFPHQREVITEVTGVPCCNLYGSAEGGLNAWECPAGSLHLTLEATAVELREPDATDPETGDPAGEILVTDLMLRTMPLIRYVINDKARLSRRSCACGLAHPLLEAITGRVSEPHLLPNGRRINPNAINNLTRTFHPLGSVRRCVFVETADKRLELWLTVSEAFEDKHRRFIERETHRALGPDLPLDLRFFDHMPAIASAKLRDYIPYPPPGEEA